MSDVWPAVFMVLISSVFRVDATSGVDEDEIQLILVKCQMASKVLLLFCCSSVQKTQKTRRSLSPCSLEKVSLTCIFIITVIICIILIVIAVWCIKKKEEAVQVWSGGAGGKHARVLQPAPSAALDSTNNYNNPASRIVPRLVLL